MTENDALRVIAALGGDLGLLRNRDVAARLIKDLMLEKMRKYNERHVPIFNAQLKFNRGDIPALEKIEIPESLFEADFKKKESKAPPPPKGFVVN